jgi:putative oxidoreductase
MKFIVFTLPGTAQFFASVGFPGWSAYVVAPFEVLAGLAILVGYRAAFVSALTLPVLAGAAWVHAGNGWVFSNANGGWEYPVVLIALALAVMLLGDGAYALGRARDAAGGATLPVRA